MRRKPTYFLIQFPGQTDLETVHAEPSLFQTQQQFFKFLHILVLDSFSLEPNLSAFLLGCWSNLLIYEGVKCVLVPNMNACNP